MTYLILAFEFMKIGLFAVGDGLASLPFLYELADKYQWFSYAELVDMIAISESTPGPLGINMATYVGYHVAGLSGSLIASVCLIIPSLIITVVICKFLSKFSENKYVQWCFYGLRPAVAGLIVAVALSLLQLAVFGARFAPGMPVDWRALLLLLLFLPAVFLGKKHPVLYIGAAAVIGVMFQF